MEVNQNKFKEIISEPFFYEYHKYDRCVIDYCILECTNYIGEKTHKEAIMFFMNKLDYDNDFSKMKSQRITAYSFFENPGNYEKEKHYLIDNDYRRPYWFLFLYPPYETGYTLNDFNNINNILFPNGKANLEIYDWNVDWSTYFEDGLEWWGARCTSIYDSSLNRIVLILASATD